VISLDAIVPLNAAYNLAIVATYAGLWEEADSNKATELFYDSLSASPLRVAGSTGRR